MLGVLKTILKTVLKYEKNTITFYGTCWNWAADFVFLLRFCTRKRSETYMWHWIAMNQTNSKCCIGIMWLHPLTLLYTLHLCSFQYFQVFQYFSWALLVLLMGMEEEAEINIIHLTMEQYFSVTIGSSSKVQTLIGFLWSVLIGWLPCRLPPFLCRWLCHRVFTWFPGKFLDQEMITQNSLTL